MQTFDGKKTKNYIHIAIWSKAASSQSTSSLVALPGLCGYGARLKSNIPSYILIQIIISLEIFVEISEWSCPLKSSI